MFTLLGSQERSTKAGEGGGGVVGATSRPERPSIGIYPLQPPTLLYPLETYTLSLRVKENLARCLLTYLRLIFTVPFSK